MCEGIGKSEDMRVNEDGEMYCESCWEEKEEKEREEAEAGQLALDVV